MLAVDLPGHGSNPSSGPFDLAAMAGDVLAQMAVHHVDPSTAIVIGHSLGGTVVSALASAISVRGVINVDQPLRLADFQAGLRQLEPLLRGDDAAFRQAIGMVFDSMRGPLSDAETARIEAIRVPRSEVVLAVWEPVLILSAGSLNALVASMTATIAAPYLAIHGIDPGPDYRDWLVQQIPAASFERWTDHGHYPHLVDPVRFATRVDEFVDALPA